MIALLTVAATAEAKNKKKGKPPAKGGDKSASAAPAHPVLDAAFGDAYRKIGLNPRQYGQLVELVQKFAPQIGKVQADLDSAYTKEQSELIQRSREMAIRAGVPRERVPLHIARTVETLELTDEQKQQLAQAKAAKAAVERDFRAEAGEFLSKEQLQKLLGQANGKTPLKKKK
ncbi:MAG: hypothetical protein KDA42_19020 [Planctomycetales bacterium]|nr:hypothetical protein [Planctomycetales bacterium]